MATVIRSGSRRLDGETLRDRALRAAAGLSALGVRPGDSVALLLRNDLALFEAQAAARLAGAYAVPINWHFTVDEALYLVEDSGARVVVAHRDLLDPLRDRLPAGVEVRVVAVPPELASAYSVDAARVQPGAGDVDWDHWVDAHAPLERPAEQPGSTMLYTSGTTGRPKGVRRAPMAEAELDTFQRRVARAFGLTADTRTVMTGPLYHSAPNSYAMIALRLGTDLLLMPRFDAEALLAIIESERITHMHLVPTMMIRLLRLPAEVRARHDLSSLCVVAHGAAPCPPRVKAEMIEWWGPVFREYYGSTEASLAASASSEEWLANPGTVGRAIEEGVIEVHDEDGRVLDAGEIGEIYTRLGGAPDFEYHGRPEDRRAVERRGLVTNGDIGYLNERGYLFLCDRKRDMIISGGVNIYPAEIEAAMLTHPGVRDCAAFGIPHDEFGEAVAAVVEREPGAEFTEAALRAHLAGEIARYKIPRLIRFDAELPRLDNGKIYKHALRAPFWADAGRNI